MNSLRALARRTTLHYQNAVRFATTTQQQQYQPRSSNSDRNWRLPETDEDIERYLMKWQNVEGHEFLEGMRTQCMNWGVANMSDKQKQAIRNCVGHKDTRIRRVGL